MANPHILAYTNEYCAVMNLAFGRTHSEDSAVLGKKQMRSVLPLPIGKAGMNIMKWF